MLDNKTIVVTGVGVENAAEIKRQGATVIGIDRNLTEDVDEFPQVDRSFPTSSRPSANGPRRT